MHDDMQPDTLNPAPAGAQQDHEGAMARADLYKLANYSLKLFKKLDDSAQLEAWVQAKITKAADYIASVYHYLEYEMKFNEYGEHLANAEVMSEDQKEQIKNKLMEARQKVAELKKIQADKITGKQVNEGHEVPCKECGGTGMVTREIPEATKEKIAKYKRLTKAMHAANKRLDKNNNGIPDNLENDEEVEEEMKVGDTKKTRTGVLTKTATGVRHERTDYSDEERGEVQDTHAKAKSAAEKKKEAPAQKKSKTGTWGMEGGQKFDNRKKEKAVDEMFGQGVYEGQADKDYDGDGKIESDKDEVWGSRAKAAAKSGKPFGKDKKVKEELKGKQHKLDVDDDGDIEADDLADLRAGKKAKDVKEGVCSTCHEDPCNCDKVDEGKKPSAGMTKKEKSATVKAAKAGKDIGKPGKNFGKVAAAAKKGGAKDPEAVAAAAMWKNKAKSLKESLEALLPEEELEEAGETQLDLEALVKQAQQMNPSGMNQAIQSEKTQPGSIAKFLADILQKAGAGAGNQTSQLGQTAQQPTMGQQTEPTSAMEEKETVAESVEFNRMKEFLVRLNG